MSDDDRYLLQEISEQLRSLQKAVAEMRRDFFGLVQEKNDKERSKGI